MIAIAEVKGVLPAADPHSPEAEGAHHEPSMVGDEGAALAPGE